MLQFHYDNDFKFTIKPKLNDELIDLTKLKDLSLIFKNNIHGFSFTPIWKLTDAGIDIEVQKEMIKWTGVYNVYITYRRPDDTFSDFFQDIKVGPPVFEIVPVERAIGKEDAAIIEISPIFKGDKGDKGDSAYEVWLKDNPGKTKEDYFAYLQKPATDAIGSIQAVEQTVSENESLRIISETDRKDAEDLRLSAEVIRIENEATRVSNENTRVENESLRQYSETLRLEAELLRESGETARVAAETIRNTSETGRVNAETERVTNINNLFENVNELSELETFDATKKQRLVHELGILKWETYE